MKKRKQARPIFKNSTVYHEASTFGADALMSKNNNSLSSREKWDSSGTRLYRLKNNLLYLVNQMINGEWFNCWNCTKGTGLPFRACLHGGRGPQVGEVTRLFISPLLLIWSRLHDRWGDPLRWVAQSARRGDTAFHGGQILPCQCFKVG